MGVTDLHLILKYKLLAKSSQKNNVRISFSAPREQRHTHLFIPVFCSRSIKAKKGNVLAFDN